MPVLDRDDSKDKAETENIDSIGKQFNHGSWYLLRVASKRKNSFLKYLEFSMSKNQLQELILEIKLPEAPVYEDIVLLNLSNFKSAYTYLQKIEYFQGIERRPLKPEEVSRMLEAK
jgi:hypothetical protein